MANDSRAFGVEPGHPPYRLRQARYHALAETVATFTERLVANGQNNVDLLDVGVGKGVSRRYIEVHDAARHVSYHAADIYGRGVERVYKHESWHHNQVDLEKGMESLASESFDIVVCEQVLEHIHNVQRPMADLARVLRPGGLLVVGVPTFPHGLHLIRKHIVPFVDRLTDRKPRPHVQAFSKQTFAKMLLEHADLEIEQVRGFRIVSGGILRPLEHYRGWWKMNRWIGARVPGLCVEIQIVARKPEPSAVSKLLRAVA